MAIPSLLRGQLAVAPDLELLKRAAPAAADPVAHQKGLHTARLNADAEPLQVSIPDHIAGFRWLGGVYGALCQTLFISPVSHRLEPQVITRSSRLTAHPRSMAELDGA